MKLSPWGGSGFTLAECRQKASQLANLRRECGGDLKRYLFELEREKQRQQLEKLAAEKIEAKKGTLADLLDTYIELIKSQDKDSVSEVKRAVKKDITQPFPELANKKARDVSPDDIVSLLSKVYQRGAKTYTNRLRSYLHAAFAYGLKADYDFARVGEKRFGLAMNPVAMVPKQGQHEKARDRYLDHMEVWQLWHELPNVDRVGVLIITAIQFLLATAGQRPKQLLRATWKDYDLNKQQVTLIDPKGKGAPRKHVVPLTKRALGLLNSVKPITGEYQWPFSTRGKSPLYVDSLSTAISRYCRYMEQKAVEQGKEPPLSFSPRDLRRTCKNLLIDAGVNRENRNLLQSHAQTGVDIEHYDRSDHMVEKCKAISKYDRLLGKILKE